MKHRSFAYLMVFVLAGCFSSEKSSGGSGLELAAPRSRTELTHPFFVRAQPGAQCTFHRPGDASGAEAIRADGNGRVYFYPPPQSWGSSLAVECTGGSATQHASIDLDDPATYEVDADLAQRARPTSIRPALTGDLDAIPVSDLLRRGYPPRPDRTHNPERYQRWVDIVSAPRVVRNLQMIKALGRKAGNYVSTVIDTVEIGNAWAGRALDVAGWTATSYSDFPIEPNNNNGDWYVQYDTYMMVPPFLGCQPSNNCYGAEWAGMGGMEPRAGISDSNLVQSGVFMEVVNGTASTALFVEYAPNAPVLALPDAITIHPYDWIEAWGWVSSDSSCADVNTSSWTPVACFSFYNITTGEYQGAAPYDLDPPSGTSFYGWTYESIVENQGSLGGLPQYGYVSFNDYAYGADGNAHSPYTDPWIYINASDSIPSQLINEVNGPTDDGYVYEIDWQAFR